MQAKLPARPHLEHLKSQAKELLAAHRRGERLAMARIREAVPAFHGKSDATIAEGPFALHDAQSAIAREYGFASWAELRGHVSAAHSPQLPVTIQYLSGQAVPHQLAEAIRTVSLKRGTGFDIPTPDELPALPLRNAVVFPGALIPLDIARTRTLDAVGAALTTQPAFLAIFAQRTFDVEVPTTDDLHPTGCLCVVRHFERLEDSVRGWIIVEGVRWVSLDAIERIDPYYVVSVANTTVQRDDERLCAELDHELRTKARRVAERLPQIRDAALSLIDTTNDIAQLADLVIVNFAPPVAEAAAYADEAKLSARLRRVISLLDQELPASSENTV